MMSPHGIPVDLLDRLVIIRTLQYVLEEIIVILNTRAKVSLLNTNNIGTVLIIQFTGVPADARYLLGMSCPSSTK